jgi:phosphoglycolate phosphatase
VEFIDGGASFLVGVCEEALSTDQHHWSSLRPGSIGHDGVVPNTLVLWDVDGTLVSCGSVGRRAIEAGARRAAGLGAVPSVTMSGKTDPQIVAEILEAAGVPHGEIAMLVPVALSEAALSLASLEGPLRARGTVHPGAHELLDALGELDQVRQTLVTGNIAANARLKVATFGLDAHLDFEVGAYGSDDAERDRLVPICLGRVRRLRGEHHASHRVWVIGDTPNDLSCARAAGVRCLLVGTGKAGFESVRSLGADAALPSLADTRTVMTLLMGE